MSFATVNSILMPSVSVNDLTNGAGIIDVMGLSSYGAFAELVGRVLSESTEGWHGDVRSWPSLCISKNGKQPVVVRLQQPRFTYSSDIFIIVQWLF